MKKNRAKKRMYKHTDLNMKNLVCDMPDDIDDQFLGKSLFWMIGVFIFFWIPFFIFACSKLNLEHVPPSNILEALQF